ncbi:hypothetical protein GCM10009127_07840 [Alteraurantiacibacter aestuarii]|uniref:Small-conductance mechanosensitive channel n=1 Tax=Alteraurantiacibacter aestuarii TaxID=650004 RepID=A0A844ZJU7_9SPHN|nr:mechanosensitive ion channel family protein [Alteraurantiacibacter aestuarii]MXO87177.1 mechanosensitive ion channel [Alteraurantiacibacter aestuarii]
MKQAFLLLALALLFAVPGHAALVQDQAPPPAPSPAYTAPPLIEAGSSANQDAAITQRIAGIFAQVPSLANVSVEADAGVVTLNGTVADLSAADRAEAIASRVSGVVTVENNVERDVSVDGGLGLGPLGEKLTEFTRMLPLIGAALLVALLIAGTGYALASLTGFWQRVAPNSFLAELIASAIRFVFVIGGIVIALDMIGAGTLLGAVLGGAGVVGIALGFAMRETVENYVASLMLSVRQPFRANDHVVIDTHEGRVIRLTSRATVLMTMDGNHLRIPNGAVFRAVILNYTRNPQRRFDFELGIDADDDPDAARALGRDVLSALPYVLQDPAPEVIVDRVGDSNIVLSFLAWIDQREADHAKARSRAIAACKRALEAGGFALPEPIYRLRFDARTTPLQFENIEEQAHAAPPPSPPPSPAPATQANGAAAAARAAHDVAPDEEVARMVDAERADRDAGEKDLLDPKRPVE